MPRKSYLGKVESGTKIQWSVYILDSYTDIRRVAAEGDSLKYINIVDFFVDSLETIGLSKDDVFKESLEQIEKETNDEINRAKKGNSHNTVPSSRLNGILLNAVKKKFKEASKFLYRSGLAPEQMVDLILE